MLNQPLNVTIITLFFLVINSSVAIAQTVSDTNFKARSHQFSYYGTYGSEAVADYETAANMGFGVALPMMEFLPDLKAEVEYTQSATHSKAGSTSGIGYTTALDIVALNGYLDYKIRFPKSWVSAGSLIQKFEITVKAGQSIMGQKLKTTPDDTSKATANPAVTGVTLLVSYGASFGYHINETWAVNYERASIGSDVTINRLTLNFSH